MGYYYIKNIKIDKNNNGYISLNAKELEDVSEYDCKYLHYEGYLQPSLDGYKLSDEYIKEIIQKSMEL